MSDIKFEMTRKQIADLRGKVNTAFKILNECENELSACISDPNLLDELPGDDPLSNLMSAVETSKEAYGDINADSDWIEVLPTRGK